MKSIFSDHGHYRMKQLLWLPYLFDEPKKIRKTLVLFFVCQLCLRSAIVASESDDIYDLTLKQLSELKLAIVTKQEQPIFTSPAAVFVLSREDIQRSGATTLPELFRLIPGVEVAKPSSTSRQVSIRGFNSAFSNKLQVLVDGRSIYNTPQSFIFWGDQDVIFNNIERVEVIRGPGASVWGSNAVNGVINIITRKSQDTIGKHLEVVGGTEERVSGTVRVGAKLSDTISYRVYGKYRERDDLAFASGESPGDDWDSKIGGFRIDLDISDVDTLTLQGDVAVHRRDDAVSFASLDAPPTFQVNAKRTLETKAGNVMVRWAHGNGTHESGWNLQSYFDYHEIDDKSFNSNDIVRTFDVDFRHHFSIMNHQLITWGLEYRSIDDHLEALPSSTFTPKEERLDYYYLFLQDEISLFDDTVQIVLGTKVEHNEITDWEHQPNIRLSWSPSEAQTIWGSVARAVRIPNRSDIDKDQILGVAFDSIEVPILGNPNPRSEKLIAYELGYRWKPFQDLFFDLALFYNDYHDLTVSKPGFFSFILDNDGWEAETYGGEVLMDWQLTDWWRIIPSYSVLQLDADVSPLVNHIPAGEGTSAQHRVLIRSTMDLFKRFELDTTLRFVDIVPASNIDSYLELDLRFAWRATENFRLEITGRNLLDSQHPEADNSFFTGLERQEVERSLWAAVKIDL